MVVTNFNDIFIRGTIVLSCAATKTNHFHCSTQYLKNLGFLPTRPSHANKHCLAEGKIAFHTFTSCCKSLKGHIASSDFGLLLQTLAGNHSRSPQIAERQDTSCLRPPISSLE